MVYFSSVKKSCKVNFLFLFWLKKYLLLLLVQCAFQVSSSNSSMTWELARDKHLYLILIHGLKARPPWELLLRAGITEQMNFRTTMTIIQHMCYYFPLLQLKDAMVITKEHGISPLDPRLCLRHISNPSTLSSL